MRGDANAMLYLIVTILLGGLFVVVFIVWSRRTRPSNTLPKNSGPRHPTLAFHSPRNHSRSSSLQEVESEEEDDEVILKGYKLDQRGRKTSYFHTEISEQEKSLIGDCSPKKIDPSMEEKSESSGSAWNKGGTWEDRDLSTWALDRVQSSLENIEISCPEDIQVSIGKVCNIHGDATITLVRGYKRYLIDYSLELEWKVTLTNRICNMCLGVIVDSG